MGGRHSHKVAKIISPQFDGIPLGTLSQFWESSLMDECQYLGLRQFGLMWSLLWVLRLIWKVVVVSLLAMCCSDVHLFAPLHLISSSHTSMIA